MRTTSCPDALGVRVPFRCPPEVFIKNDISVHTEGALTAMSRVPLSHCLASGDRDGARRGAAIGSGPAQGH